MDVISPKLIFGRHRDISPVASCSKGMPASFRNASDPRWNSPSPATIHKTPRGKKNFRLHRDSCSFHNSIAPRRQLRVGLIGTASAANDARFPGGRKAPVTRPPGIQTRNPCPAAKKIERGPSTKRACADDGDMRFGVHQVPSPHKVYACSPQQLPRSVTARLLEEVKGPHQ